MRHVFLAAAAAALAACAGTPEPPTAPAPAPVPSTPSGLIPGSLEEFRVLVGDRVFFSYDRYDLSAEARSALERQAAWLRQYRSVYVVIAGNCDARESSALSARRAAAVRKFLISLGVQAGRIQTISYGRERPIDPRHNEVAWSVNRNAQTLIVSGAAI